MVGDRIIHAIGARIVRALIGDLPTQAELDAIIADHPLMKLDHSDNPEQ